MLLVLQYSISCQHVVLEECRIWCFFSHIKFIFNVNLTETCILTTDCGSLFFLPLFSVELDFKQQEDKLQPVLRKLHPIEETQVAPLPYSQESYSSTPKQKSKTESKKHGRWKLWFL